MTFSSVLPILAQMGDLPQRAESVAKSGKMLAGDLTAIFLIGAVIFGALLLWAKYLRNRRKRVRGGEKVYRTVGVTEDPDEGIVEERRRYKRRMRRRSHRSRNPTLAETGGLPPGAPGSKGPS
jgi:hypothetical protein